MREKVFGKIAPEPVGENGFGYDPILYGNKSFAQVDSETRIPFPIEQTPPRKLLEQLTKAVN